MRQIWIPRAGDTDVLEVRELPDPRPAEGEVAIEVRNSGINFADIMARMGMYFDPPSIPCVPGYEVSGVVEEAGIGVRDVRPGDRVMAITRFGGYSTRVCVPEEQVLPLPERMDFESAAALPVAYLTAYLVLFTLGGLSEGERVFVHSLGGGVGLAALQLAATVGGEVYGSASPHKHELLMKEGAAGVIDSSLRRIDEAVMRLTSGAGVHLILDSVGGRSIRMDRHMLSPLGRIVAYGISSSARSRKRSLSGLLRTVLSTPRFGLFGLINANTGILGLNLARLWGEISRLRCVLQRLIGLWEEGKIAPRVDRIFAFDDVGDAHRYVQERRNIGKVLLRSRSP